MTRFDAQTWIVYAQAMAFCGNSLLDTVHHTGDMGLDPTFWDAFPVFDDGAVAQAVAGCRTFAERAQAYAAEGGDPDSDASVEYTRLFVGPPHPAAAPWETFYRGGASEEGDRVGFGKATFEMRDMLREAGLQVSNENNQYADHMGIELLYISVMAERAAEQSGDDSESESCAENDASGFPYAQRARSFVIAHPLLWIDAFQKAIDDAAPDGYYAHLLMLAHALLMFLQQ